MEEQPPATIGSCAKCMQPIRLDHPYAWCGECGEYLPEALQAQLPRLRKISEDAAADLASMKAKLLATEAVGPVKIKGHPLRCVICQHDYFSRRLVQLTAPLVALFEIDWLGDVAICFVCGECGYVHSFIPPNVTDQD